MFAQGKMKIFTSILMIGIASIALSGCSSRKDGVKSAAEMYDSKTGGIGLGTLERVHFGFDQSSIDETAANILEKNAKIIKGNSEMKVLVEGNCDEKGTNEYNVALGERRARTALDHLVSLGVARNKLEMKSWGEERPLDVASSEKAHAYNRRAEFVILSK